MQNLFENIKYKTKDRQNKKITHRKVFKLMENIEVVIPKKLENLNLPDPDLLHLYEDEDGRRIYLEGTIGTDEDPLNNNASEIVKTILRYNREDKGLSSEERKPIKIFIDSAGGDVSYSLVLAQTMLLSKTPIYTINLCNAYSAAGLILVCGHKKFGLPGSSVLIHSGSLYVGGTREQADSTKKFFDKLDKKFNDLLLARTKIDTKTYKQKAPKDWFLDTDECLKYGLIDEVVKDLDKIL